MTATRDPLEGIERVLIDGNNLLGAMRRGILPAGSRAGGPTGSAPGGVERLPAAALVGRIRAVIPPHVRIELVFDGPADPGGRNVRVATGVSVAYSGRVSADALLIRLVSEAGPLSLDHAATLLVVTDDAALGTELRRRGAITARTAWLIRRLERTASGMTGGSRGAPATGGGRVVGLGQGRPPVATSDPGVDDRPGWRPGRGATVKKGNAKRRPRSAGRDAAL